jgi:phosphoglycerate dehydrogenase-like enzyme
MQVVLPILLILAAAVAPAQTKKVLVFGMRPPALAELQSVSQKVKIEAAPTDPARLREAVRDAEGMIGNVPPELIAESPRLRWVQTNSAGVERYRAPEIVNSSVILTNCKILQGPNIADHAFALLLGLTRGVHLASRNRGEWTGGAYQPIELMGKTAVVIGVGGIGSQIAQRAHAFGMRVIGVDPKEMPYNPFVTRMVFPDRLESVLPEADVVFVAAPLTAETELLMNSKRFGLMKQGSYFIAVSRGGLIDTDALMQALDSRKLAGAGLDVTNPEPLPKGHPLWNFDNVIITPHIAHRSDNVQERRMNLFKTNLARFAEGEPLVNVVDKKKGY